MLDRKQLSIAGSKVWIILALLLAIAPAIMTGSMILQYGVNVPFWDQWDVARLLVEQAEGNLSIQDLLAQHNEHRIFFPRLIFLTLASLSRWNVKYEMLFIFLLACIISLSIYSIFRLTVTQNRFISLLFIFLVNVLVFSPVQYECWLWGFQITFFLPITCFVLALLATQLRISFWLKLSFCIVLSIISTFSLANGAICWLILLPVLLTVAEDVKGKTLFRVAVPLWLLGFFLSVGIYISGYERPKAHPEILNITERFSTAADYFLCFLGAPFASENLVVSRLMGFLFITLYAFVLLYVVTLRQQKLLKQSIVWLALGSYTIISAVMASLSRANFGVQQALGSRYMTITIYLAIALIGLFVIVAEDTKTNEKAHRLLSAVQVSRQSSRDIAQIALTCLITASFVLSFVSATNAYPLFQHTQRDRLYAKTCLIFINFVPQECIKQYLYPFPAKETRRLARQVNRLGFLSPPVAKSRNIADLTPAAPTSSAQFGTFDAIAPASQDTYTATGWATLPQHGKPADSVLLTYQDPDKIPVLFAIASVRNPRPDVAISLKDERYRNVGWTASFSAKQLPQAQNLVIEAWAFDTEQNQAFRIAQQHLLSVSNIAQP